MTINNIKSQFTYKNYHAWDSPAKKAVRKFLISMGCELSPDVEDYNADIKVIKPEISYHEVEVKLGWKDKWPEWWPTVHIPYRKKRLIDMMDTPDRLTFYILNRDLSKAWSIKGSLCKDPVEIHNKNVINGEYFFNVPIKNATLVTLQ